jgi:hypothetical protein
MNSSLHITATVDRPQLLKNTVEKLAQRRTGITYSEAVKTECWQSFNSSSVETFITGSLAFKEDDHCSPLFTTRFLFTCIQETTSGYALSWSLSLS